MHFTVVSYTFPPSEEIGGRRWAKFSQHLSKMGHQVTVICSNKSTDVDWYKREYPLINFRLLPKRYPSWLSGNTKSLAEKLCYFLATRILNIFTRKNIFDRAIAWRRPLLVVLKDLHQNQKIDILVTTGAPFSILYYGAEFKKTHPEIVYVTDFRDPWTWGGYYGLKSMALYKLKYQQYMESQVIEISDKVCYPTPSMGDFLKHHYPAYADKMFLLTHAYDPEKFPSKAENEIRAGFIYGGTLYGGIDGYLKKIAEVIKSNPDSGFKWKIYTNTQYPLSADSLFLSPNVEKLPFVEEKQLFKELKKASAYLVLFPASDKDIISTKFYEIIYSNTPILYIGEEGELGRFIRESRVGVHILPENIELELPKYLNGHVPFEKGYFDISQYSFDNVTKFFLKILNDDAASKFMKSTVSER